MRRGQFVDAVRALQPALRGGVEAGNYYVTAPELHEALAHAWDTLGTEAGRRTVTAPVVGAAAARDSALTHYASVVAAWAQADPPVAARAAAARARLAVLKSTLSPTSTR